MIRLFFILWGHVIDFATRIPELYTDPVTGRLSHSKGGMLIAGMCFTAKMLLDMPDDWELWATFVGTVGGYAAARDLVKRKFPVGVEPPGGPER